MNSNNSLSNELDFVSGGAKDLVRDAVQAILFSKGNELGGNTQANDLNWFAREIYEEMHPFAFWKDLPSEQREHWHEIASASLNRLPSLMERIADRCRVQSETLRSLMESEKANE